METSQIIEAVIHYIGEISLIVLSIYVLLRINVLSGFLIFQYGLFSIIILLSLQDMFGLGIITETLLSTTNETGRSVPTLAASIIGIIGGLSKILLATGILLLARQVTTSNHEHANAS